MVAVIATLSHGELELKSVMLKIEHFTSLYVKIITHFLTWTTCLVSPLDDTSVFFCSLRLGITISFMLPWLPVLLWIGILLSQRPEFLLDLMACRHRATAALTEAMPALTFCSLACDCARSLQTAPNVEFHFRAVSTFVTLWRARGKSSSKGWFMQTVGGLNWDSLKWEMQGCCECFVTWHEKCKASRSLNALCWCPLTQPLLCLNILIKIQKRLTLQTLCSQITFYWPFLA